jgi:hypothetical protein
MVKSLRLLSTALKIKSSSPFTKGRYRLTTEKGQRFPLGTIFPVHIVVVKTLPHFYRVFWLILSYKNTIMQQPSSSYQSLLSLRTIQMFKMRCLPTTQSHCKAILRVLWAGILQTRVQEQLRLITFQAWLVNKLGSRGVHMFNLVEVYLPPSRGWTNISTIRLAQQLWLRRSRNFNLTNKKEETLRILWLNNSG